MAKDDFDVGALAAYLHLLPAQIERLADRDKIPARKVAGQWRFSRAEIHHWLEDRIGVSDDEELAHMENVLSQVSTDTDDVHLAELLPATAIAVPLKARTRSSVVTEMAELAASTGLLWDAGKMVEAVQAREAMHPTALENGVALLHPRRPMASILGQALLALGIASNGLPFGDRSGRLTDVFFLICSLDDRGHLRILARLSRLVSQPDFLSALREADTAEEAHRLVSQYEADLN